MGNMTVEIGGLDDLDLEAIVADEATNLRGVQNFRKLGLKQRSDAWPAAAVLSYLTGMGMKVDPRWLNGVCTREVVDPEIVGIQLIFTDQDVATLLKWCFEHRLFLPGFWDKYKTFTQRQQDQQYLDDFIRRGEYYATLTDDELVYEYRKATERDDDAAREGIAKAFLDRESSVSEAKAKTRKVADPATRSGVRV